MRQFRRGVAAVVLAFAMAATAAPAGAEPPQDAAKLCRQFDEAGVLAEAGVNRGECVNLLKGPENAISLIAGLCGAESVQQVTGTTNKGQCIEFFRGFLSL